MKILGEGFRHFFNAGKHVLSLPLDSPWLQEQQKAFFCSLQKSRFIYLHVWNRYRLASLLSLQLSTLFYVPAVWFAIEICETASIAVGSVLRVASDVFANKLSF